MTRVRRAVAAVLTAVLAAVALVAVPAAVQAPPAAAADLAGFDPGQIISDSVFYDTTSMSAAQVQQFIAARGASCSPAAGATCLKDYRETTWTRAADSLCSGTYTGAATETAAQIISKVAAACGISPQVLLVTLQKEQGLVTATAGRSAEVYRKAMGFGCPDTAPCEAQYYGFFNQVYSAARQFQNYAKNPTRYAHRAGMVNQVRFHPNAACGTSSVYIANQATASLYNYTPYQPNRAALAAGYGTGDSCSSYGNRNFWNYFTDWFGSTIQRAPVGSLEAVSSPGSGQVRVSGWALDPDSSASTSVHVYVGGVGTAVTADRPRADVAAAYGKGANHGFDATVPAGGGAQTVCVYAMDLTGGPATSLGCATVTVRNALPIGTLEAVTPAGTGKVRVTGWALDPDTTAPISVHVYVDGVGRALTADRTRNDVGAAFGKGSQHGFDATLAVSGGRHTVCANAIDSTGGQNTSLGCVTVTVDNRVPIGSLELVSSPRTGEIRVTGWALDPDTTAPIQVHVYIGSAGRAVRADRTRNDIAKAFGKGAEHGFDATFAAATGTHTVCAYAIDSDGGANLTLGCSTVTVRNLAPLGSLESVAASGMEQVTVSGWALDPDTSDSSSVQVLIDGKQVQTAVADLPRADVANAFGLGAAHGFRLTVPSAGGRHEVCVRALDTTGGPSLALGCRTVDVNAYAVGNLEAVTAGTGTVRVSGWALDPNTSDSIAVHVYVGAAGSAHTASLPRNDVAAAYGLGAAHGFDVTRPAASGANQVCAYAIDSAGGANVLLGCQVVTVP